MSEHDTEAPDDTQGHRAAMAVDPGEIPVEGGRRGPRLSGDEDDVQGHVRAAATDEDDVQGHVRPRGLSEPEPGAPAMKTRGAPSMKTRATDEDDVQGHRAAVADESDTWRRARDGDEGGPAPRA